MENKYVYKVESCLKRFLAYDDKGAGFLLNRIHVFNSATGEVVLFTASRTDIYNGDNPTQELDQKKEIDFGSISRRVKLNLTKKGHFVIKSTKKDTWEDKPQYELYLDDAILNGSFERIESEATLSIKQRDIYSFEINGHRYHMTSCITSQDKPLEVHKEYQIKKLQYIMDKMNEATTKEELDKLVEKYTRGIYINDRELYKEDK